ncbi:MAG: hypothetical protein ACLFV6_09065 [Spirulinaceae cyanobacterium]
MESSCAGPLPLDNGFTDIFEGNRDREGMEMLNQQRRLLIG